MLSDFEWDWHTKGDGLRHLASVSRLMVSLGCGANEGFLSCEDVLKSDLEKRQRRSSPQLWHGR